MQTSDLEGNTRRDLNGPTDQPQTHPQPRPASVPQRTLQQEATRRVRARRVEPEARGCEGTRAQDALGDRGAPGDKRTQRASRASRSRLRPSAPRLQTTPARALAPDTHTHTATQPHPQAPGRAPPRSGAHQLQAAEGDKRAAPAALAHGSGAARAVCRGAPRARRPPLLCAPGAPRPPRGAPGRRGRAPRAGPGSAGASGPGPAARAPSPWCAGPRLLCLAGRPPGAPPAPGRRAGSARRGAQHRARRGAEQHCPAGAAARALGGHGFPAPPRGSAAAAATEREGSRGGAGWAGRPRERSGGEGSGGEAGSEAGRVQAWGLTTLGETWASLPTCCVTLGKCRPSLGLSFLKVGIILSASELSLFCD